jgi:hypothetical protein
MRAPVAGALVALAASSGLVWGQRAVEFEARYWNPRSHSRIRVTSGGVGSDIDFRKDLGIPDTKFQEGRFTFQGRGMNRLRFAYTPIDYAGDGKVARTVWFDGRQYTAGTRVLSNLEIRHFQLGWACQFINIHDGAFKLGTLLQANGFLMKGRLRAPDLTPSVDQSENIRGGLPAVGLALDINPHRKVNVFGEFAGLKIRRYGYFVHSDAGIKIRPVNNGFITVGYRNFNLHAKNEPDFARFELRGLFVGGGAHF